jgi:hypothetical protein
VELHRIATRSPPADSTLIVAALVIVLAVMAYVLIFHPAGASLVVNGHAIA